MALSFTSNAPIRALVNFTHCRLLLSLLFLALKSCSNYFMALPSLVLSITRTFHFKALLFPFQTISCLPNINSFQLLSEQIGILNRVHRNLLNDRPENNSSLWTSKCNFLMSPHVCVIAQLVGPMIDWSVQQFVRHQRRVY